jgi:hypothetical protein
MIQTGVAFPIHVPALGCCIFEWFPFAVKPSKAEVRANHTRSSFIDSPIVNDTFVSSWAGLRSEMLRAMVGLGSVDHSHAGRSSSCRGLESSEVRHFGRVDVVADDAKIVVTICDLDWAKMG